MSIDSTKPTSRRGYVSKAEIAEFTGALVGTITDKLVDMSEEMIDNYVGFIKKFIHCEIKQKAVGGGANTLTLNTLHQNQYYNDYFKNCEVEIIGGTGEGQRKKITGSTYAGVITIDSNWTTQPDSTSFYVIYQLAKFPRLEDVQFDNLNTPYTYYKRIPEEIKRAVCAQYEFIIEMGEDYFNGSKLEKQSESIGDYSYSNANNAVGITKMISTKAKSYLNGIINRTGKIVC